MDLPSTISSGLAFVLFMLGFGFIIFVHEMGHFLVAKWVGIKCTQFALGMGHALFSYRKGLGFRFGSTEAEYDRRLREGADPKSMDETEYRLNWLPLGGYVKMVGQEDMDATALSEDPRAFNKQSVGARMAVVSAGVIMNGIFAVVFFVAAFLHGVEFPPARVGMVVSGLPAATTPAEGHPEIIGLQPGDTLVKINGAEPSDFTDMTVASALAAPGSKIEITVDRPAFEGQPAQQLSFRIPTVENRDSGFQSIGVAPPFAIQLARADDPELVKEFKDLGLAPNAVLKSVNGKPIEQHWQLMRMIQHSAGRELELLFDAGDKSASKPVAYKLKPVTELMIEKDDTPHLLGLVPATAIERVIAGKPADGKLQPGDIIAAVNDVKFPRTDEARKAITASRGPVSIQVIRNGKTVTENLEPKNGVIGIAMRADSLHVMKILPESPFAPLQLTPGAQVLKVNNQQVESLSQLRQAIQAAQEGRIALTCQLPLAGGIVETKNIQLTSDQQAKVASLAWQVDDALPFQMLRETQKAPDAWSAVKMGVYKTHLFMMQTYVTLARTMQGTVKVEHLRGPIGIISGGTKFTEKGWSYMLFFLGLISISVAVFNFLPLPVVDGGLAVLLIVEKIRGRPVPPKVANAITTVGLVLLGTLALVLTWQDIMRDIVPFFRGS